VYTNIILHKIEFANIKSQKATQKQENFSKLKILSTSQRKFALKTPFAHCVITVFDCRGSISGVIPGQVFQDESSL
jgi:hypothetical protein